MAPKAMKRPAAATATMAPAKRGRKPAVDPELKAKCAAIEGALMSYDALPENVRLMMSGSLEHTLYTMKEDRHQFQHNMVEMLAEILTNIESMYNTEIQCLEEKVGNADAEKATLTQSEVEVQAEVDKLKAITSEASAGAQAAAKLTTEAKAALVQAKADQATGDAAFQKQEGDKAKLESTLNGALIPLKEASAKAYFAKEEKRQLKDFAKVCQEFKIEPTLIDTAIGMFPKDPESRGTFDKMVHKQLEEIFQERIAQLASELEVHAPGKAERAEFVTLKESELATAETTLKEKEEALTAAQGNEAEATKLLAEKAKALKNFTPELKKASNALDKAKTALEDFKSSALQGFLDLKELAPPPPPAPEPEPVPEEAAAIVEAEPETKPMEEEVAPAESAPAESAPAESAPAESAEVTTPAETAAANP